MKVVFTALQLLKFGEATGHIRVKPVAHSLRVYTIIITVYIYFGNYSTYTHPKAYDIPANHYWYYRILYWLITVFIIYFAMNLVGKGLYRRYRPRLFKISGSLFKLIILFCRAVITYLKFIGSFNTRVYSQVPIITLKIIS